MSKASRPVVILIGVAILACIVAVVGLVVVIAAAWYGGNRVEEEVQHTEIEKQIKGLDAAIRQYKSLHPARPEDAATKTPAAKKPATEAAQPETSVKGQHESDGQDKAEMEAAAIVKKVKEMMFSVTPGDPPAAGRQQPTMSLPARRRVRQLSLTDQQKEQVEAYDNEFRPLYDARRADLKLRMEAAFQAVREAQAAKDVEAEATARQGIRKMSAEHSKVMKELDKQYLEGLKPILTDQQAAELEKTPGPVGTAFGYMEMKGPDGLSTFKVIEPSRDSPPLSP